MAMPPRDASGKFRKRHRTTRKTRHASEARTTRRRAPRRAARRAPRARVYEASPRRAPRRRSTGGHRRSTRGRRRSTRRQPVNVAIVQPQARELRRRSTRPGRMRRAREPYMFGGGGVMLFTAGGTLGALAADVAHRYVSGVSPSASATTAPTYPTPQTGATAIADVPTYNDYAVAARPSMTSIGIQLVLAIFGFGLGAFVKMPALKSIFYGFGVGSFLHLATQLINAYVLEPLFSGKDAGARMYQHEWNADGKFGAGTMSGPPKPSQMGQQTPAPQLGQGARGARLPSALATMAAARGAGNPFAGGGPPARFSTPASPAVPQTGLAATAPPATVLTGTPSGGTPAAPGPSVPPPGGSGSGTTPTGNATMDTCTDSCQCAKCGQRRKHAAASAMGQPLPENGEPPKREPSWFDHPAWQQRLLGRNYRGFKRAA